MPPDDRVRVLHMIRAAEMVATFIAGRQRADLNANHMLLFALVRAVEIIGEAVSKVSPETRAAAPAVPWVQITAMRDRLIHVYFDVDHDILWRTARDEVPALVPLLRPLVGDE